MRLHLHLRRCRHRFFYATELRALRKARTLGATWQRCERCTHWIVTDRQVAA